MNNDNNMEIKNKLKVNLKDRIISKMGDEVEKKNFQNEPGVDLVIDLWNNGMTIREIAEKTQKTVETVKMIVWFRKIFG